MCSAPILPCQHQVRGTADLLAAPISLKGSVAGKPIAWNKGQVALETVSPVEAAIWQTQESGPLSLKIKSSVGYDGYLIFDCEGAGSRGCHSRQPRAGNSVAQTVDAGALRSFLCL